MLVFLIKGRTSIILHNAYSCSAVVFELNLASYCSVFEGKTIPYPKREFLTDDDDDKADTGASKVNTYLI